jgi:hypothetical protein
MRELNGEFLVRPYWCDLGDKNGVSVESEFAVVMVRCEVFLEKVAV